MNAENSSKAKKKKESYSWAVCAASAPPRWIIQKDKLASCDRRACLDRLFLIAW